MPYWWRDDDAVEHTPALERLLHLAEKHQAPVTLAVIPALFQASLVARLKGHPLVQIACHGWHHTNHAPTGDKKSEYPESRSWQEIEVEIAEGFQRLRLAFGEQVLPLFVPPWNRMALLHRERLSCSYSGIAHDARTGDYPVHIDGLRWKPAPPVFAGEERCRNALQHLAGADERIGLLTHHLVHDENTWVFLDSWLGEQRWNVVKAIVS